jgi:hypothetical protein
MKSFIAFLAFATVSTVCCAQTIVGSWQMVKHTSCVEDEMDMKDNESKDLVKDMKSMAGTTPQILTLKENNNAEESTKIISRRKSYNSKSFLYKFNGDALYFLDKKSRTIIEGYTVEKFSADSLIISSAERACETKIFIRIK